MRYLNIILLLIIGVFFTACVPAKKVNEINDNYDKCETIRKKLAEKNAELEKAATENVANLYRANDKIAQLVKDTARTGEQFRQLQYQYRKLQKTNRDLLEKQNVLTSGSQAENKKLMAELLKLQENLQAKEDSLKILAYDLRTRKGELTSLSANLYEREQRVKELEGMLVQKDATVTQLKQQMKEALIGFEDKGITVEQRSGRVYVSMEAQLLFASGSTDVGYQGKKAIIQLAKALENQKDLTILVEGHTDTDKLSGKGPVKDNWELSAKRATEVVRIMLNHSNLNPSILTAAGRGEYSPIADNSTPEGKAKNRRIEVILTPNLDKLFQILEDTK